MSRFIFTGGHDTHTLGYDFPANLPVDIPAAEAGVIAKLRGNRFFTEVTAPEAPAATTDPAETERLAKAVRTAAVGKRTGGGR